MEIKLFSNISKFETGIVQLICIDGGYLLITEDLKDWHFFWTVMYWVAINKAWWSLRRAKRRRGGDEKYALEVYFEVTLEMVEA